MKKLLIVFLNIFLIIISINPINPEYKLNSEEQKYLFKKTDEQWNKFFNNNKKISIGLRELAEFTLNAVAIDYDNTKIEKALKTIKESQDNDTNSKTYGNFLWNTLDTSIKDLNGVEFTTRTIVLIWILYKNKLNQEQTKILNEIINLSIEGIKRHKVKTSYTNIILMKIWNLIAIGEYFNKNEVAEEGYKLLKEWIIYIYENGINEFLSPTYYTVDIENLSLIYNFSKNQDAKTIAKSALDYIWTDIALNWYSPSQRLGGTHSRDYDRLYGHGSLDNMLLRAGWISDDNYQYYLTDLFNYYSFTQPNHEIKKYLDSPIPRYVYQRWGEQSYERASQYISKNFSVCSSESCYWNMDKTPLVINIGSGEYVPVINFFMEGRGDYYGLKRKPDSSGHLKSLHLIPFISSVQNDSEVLFIASVKDDAEYLTGLESVITLPADSEIWLNNNKLNIFKETTSWSIYGEPDDITTFIKVLNIDNKPAVNIIDKDNKKGVGIYQLLKIIPGNDYSLKASIKGGSIYLYLNFYDKNKKLISPEHNKKIIPKQDNFEWFEYKETAPINAVYCRAWIYSTISSTTEIYINDIMFEDLSKNNNEKKVLASFDFKTIKEEKIEINSNTNIFIKREDVVSVLRVLKALDVSKKEISVVLYNDGLSYKALRLTATHSAKRTYKRGTIAVWSYAEEGITDELKFEEFRSKINSVKSEIQINKNEYNISVNGINGTFSLMVDVEKEKRISRQGMKNNTDNHLLSINGKDIGREILSELEIIKNYIKNK